MPSEIIKIYYENKCFQPGGVFYPEKLPNRRKWKKTWKVGKVEEPVAPDAQGTEAAVSN